MAKQNTTTTLNAKYIKDENKTTRPFPREFGFVVLIQLDQIQVPFSQVCIDLETDLSSLFQRLNFPRIFKMSCLQD